MSNRNEAPGPSKRAKMDTEPSPSSWGWSKEELSRLCNDAEYRQQSLRETQFFANYCAQIVMTEMQAQTGRVNETNSRLEKEIKELKETLLEKNTHIQVKTRHIAEQVHIRLYLTFGKSS